MATHPSREGQHEEVRAELTGRAERPGLPGRPGEDRHDLPRPAPGGDRRRGPPRPHDPRRRRRDARPPGHPRARPGRRPGRPAGAPALAGPRGARTERARGSRPRSESPQARGQGRGQALAGAEGSGAPPAFPASRSPPTTISPSGRSTGGSRSSANPQLRKVRDYERRTSPARASCAPSTASSRTSRYGFAITRVALGCAPSHQLSALRRSSISSRELVQRLGRALRADGQLGELLAHVLGRVVEGVAPVRDLILRPVARLARDVPQPRHRVGRCVARTSPVAFSPAARSSSIAFWT